MNHIFGPVPSRRLGRSLGVDVVPYKTCSYDCVYCQIGCTTCKTIERREWVPLAEILPELEKKLSPGNANPDYITLSGSGEPTLYSRIGELIDGIKAISDVPIAVLTNGSLLWMPDVRADLMKADLVVPSLDAGSEEVFRKVNRPHEDISFEKMLGGLIDFRREFGGKFWLEVLILAGMNDGQADIDDLIACAGRIEPDCVQLNTVTRPPAESFAVGIPMERLLQLAAMFDPPAEVIADFKNVHKLAEFSADRQAFLDTLQRRPCSIDDISAGLGLHRNEVVKYVEDLAEEGLIEKTSVQNKLYYQAKK